MSVVELLLVKEILFHDMVILLHSMMVGSWMLIKMMVCLAMVIVLLIWLVVTTFSFGRGSTETLVCDNVL